MRLTKEELLERQSAAQGVYLDEIDDALLGDAGCCPAVAVLPEDFARRARYLADMLAQICCRLQGADPAFGFELRNISAALSYLLNSASAWQGQYMDYDRLEIDRKLGR